VTTKPFEPVPFSG